MVTILPILGQQSPRGRQRPDHADAELSRRPVLDESRTIAFGDSRGGDVPHGTIRSRSTRRTSGRVRPQDADQFAFARVLPGFDPYGPDETGTDIVYYFSPAEERHNGRANVVFVDGHTESHTLDDLGYVTVSPVPFPAMPANNVNDSAFPDPWPSDGPYPQPTSFRAHF